MRRRGAVALGSVDPRGEPLGSPPAEAEAEAERSGEVTPMLSAPSDQIAAVASPSPSLSASYRKACYSRLRYRMGGDGEVTRSRGPQHSRTPGTRLRPGSGLACSHFRLTARDARLCLAGRWRAENKCRHLRPGVSEGQTDFFQAVRCGACCAAFCGVSLRCVLRLQLLALQQLAPYPLHSAVGVPGRSGPKTTTTDDVGDHGNGEKPQATRVSASPSLQVGPSASSRLRLRLHWGLDQVGI